MSPVVKKTIKRTFWGALLFYLLIAFEFFYMASPFALYFYSVYRPVLDFLNQSPALGWLVCFFLPHAAETSSAFINMHNTAGAALAVSGFFAFCLGAGQVYYHKLAGKGVVTGGIYNLIRHPQYASFAICSFGLLLLWPRYIVLIMFIAMLFAYYLLARAEERECEAKFGQSYIEYKNKAGMFFPFRIRFPANSPALPKSGFERPLGLLVVYLLVLFAGIGLAKGLDSFTRNSLYTFCTSDSAYLSVAKIEETKLKEIINIALANEEVKASLEKAGENRKTKLLNYVLPSEWYVPEIPMNGIGANVVRHIHPQNYNPNVYKVIFNKADMRGNQDVKGKEIIFNVAEREPLFEVWLNVPERKVIKIRKIDKSRYGSIPVAIY